MMMTTKLESPPLVCNASTRLQLVALAWLISMQHVALATSKHVLVGQPEETAFALSGGSADAAGDMHRLVKRMDLEMCIGHFDVHKNTIIRTGESQAIGGKYLQGLELDSIEECERLCCETEACDVYIFERKSGGYCYLFECGPPENFHCKFTRHANYTSAVLTPQVRHVNELTTPRPSLAHIDTTNISQQEWELTNLKIKPEIRDSKPATVAATSTAAAAGALPAVVISQTEVSYPQKAVNESVHCGRFQFLCHSGECIAVYNACDGIPQCEDGSDEGPECNGMPAVVSTSKLNAAATAASLLKPVIINQYQPAMLQQQPQTETQKILPAIQLQPQQLPAINNVQTLPQSPVLAPIQPQVTNNREDAAAWANRKLIADAQQQQQQQANLNNNAVELNSQIFSHKGGLQVANAAQSNSNAAYNSVNMHNNLGPMYAVSLQRNGVYMPVVPQQVQQQQQPAMLQQPINMQWSPAVQQQQMPIEQSAPSYIVNTAAQQMLPPPPPPPGSNIAQQPPVAVQGAPVKASASAAAAANAIDTEQAEEYEDYDVKSTEAPKKKLRKHKKPKNKTHPANGAANVPQTKDPIELSLEQQKHQNGAAAVAAAAVAPTPPTAQPANSNLSGASAAAAAAAASPVHEQYKMIHENLALEFRDHDGHSERPGGAVLSLTLGLLVTAALSILIGCRMRTVGRRARRLGGKTPYSQEADFLVNGMYL